MGSRHRRGRGGVARRVRRLPAPLRDGRRTRPAGRRHARDGEGRHYITLPGYAEQFVSRLGYEPFPGTLNVELDEESVRRRGEIAGVDAVPIDAWEDDDRTYGAAACYAVTIVADGRRYDDAHAIVPDRTHHDDDQLELIAPDELREELALADGDEVEVRVEAASRADEPAERADAEVA